jgi:hypothetical protein
VEESDEDERTSDVDEVDEFERKETPEVEEEDERSAESEIEKFNQREDVSESSEAPHEENEINLEVSSEATTMTSSTTTEMSNEISGQVESEIESDEDSNEDEERSDVEAVATHHQSSTVGSDVGSECDDGWRLDDHGRCVGEFFELSGAGKSSFLGRKRFRLLWWKSIRTAGHEVQRALLLLLLSECSMFDDSALQCCTLRVEKCSKTSQHRRLIGKLLPLGNYRN